MRHTLVLSCLLIAGSAAAVPRYLPYEGRLLNADGSPVNGVQQIGFALFGASENGTKLWSETQQLAFSDGYYVTELGTATPLPDVIFGGDLYLEVSIAAAPLSPRLHIDSVAFALRADSATNLSGGTVDASAISVGGTAVIDSTGHLTGPAAYQSGSGISIDATTQTVGLLSSCANGQILKKTGGQWACAADNGATYTAGSGIDLTNNVVGLTAACAVGQLLKWDGTNWNCTTLSAPTYAAGTGLALTGNTFSLTTACTSGQLLRYDGTSWSCSNEILSTYRAGNGVTIASNGAIALASNGCLLGDLLKFDGSQWNCAAETITKYTAATGGGLGINGTALSLEMDCNNGQILKFDGTKWSCQADANNVYTASGGIQFDSTGKNFQLLQSCTKGQDLKWTGTDWACASANYVAGTGLVLNGNSFSLPACAANQMLRFDGANWGCSADTISSATGSGITITGSQVALLAGCAAGQALVFDGTNWNCGAVAPKAATGGGLTVSGTNIGLVTGCADGQVLVWKANTSSWTCSATTSVAVGGGLALASGQVGLVTSCSDGQTLQWKASTSAWVCATPVVSVTNPSSDGTITVGTSGSSATVVVNPQKVQLRVSGTCAIGYAITAINQDGSVSCSSTEPVIRWALFSTYDQACCWIFADNASLFGGVNASSWGDGNAVAWSMDPTASTMRTLFNKKMYVGANANVWADTWYTNSSTNSKQIAVLMRIQNTTSAAINWTPYFYYSAYAGWQNYASLTLNGQASWSYTGSTGASATASPTLAIPAGRTSTVVMVIPQGPPSGTSTTGLAFYNNSLTLPSGLQFVDDLGTLTTQNVWNQ